jgi:hypothetical protein
MILQCFKSKRALISGTLSIDSFSKWKIKVLQIKWKKPKPIVDVEQTKTDATRLRTENKKDR